jgi:hypothetical protein
MQGRIPPSTRSGPAGYDQPAAEVIHLARDDDLTLLRQRLRKTQRRRVVLSLPWETTVLSRALDYELLLREAEGLQLETAIVSPDPARRGLAQRMGLSAFPTVERAQAASSWRRPVREPAQPPKRGWWEEEVSVQPAPSRIIPDWARHAWQGTRLLVFLATLLILMGSTYIVGPQATMTLVPSSLSMSIIVPVSAGLDVEAVDTAARVIPASRVGDYFEGYIEVETTGTAAFVSGRATGSVLFTNLLPQDVSVPAGTVVRTSAGSFPVRFSTTQEAVVPALGQAPAPIQALEDGPAGNVGVNQINRVEGIAGLALRVTNPDPTVGGATQEVRAVSQADMDRARELLTAQLLDEAYDGLQAYLESPTLMLARHSLAVQASETSYNRFLTERADTLGLHMRLLVTGLALDRDNAEAVAYATLVQDIPPDYELIGTGFEVGEMAEEPLGTADLTLFVTATGYAAARLDADSVRRAVLGRPLEEARDNLQTELPLAEPPQLTIWPEWFNRMPLLPVRIAVQIVPR